MNATDKFLQFYNSTCVIYKILLIKVLVNSELTDLSVKSYV